MPGVPGTPVCQVIILDGGESIYSEEIAGMVHAGIFDPVRLTINDGPDDDPITITLRMDAPDNTIITAKVVARDWVLACRTVMQQHPDLFAGIMVPI